MISDRRTNQDSHSAARPQKGAVVCDEATEWAEAQAVVVVNRWGEA